MKKRALCSLAMAAFWCSVTAVHAQTLSAALKPYDIGVIFNTDDLLLDFDSYQGGVGLKLSGDKLAYRLLLDFFYSTESDALDVSLGGAVERHLSTGRVTPYLGGHLKIGFGWADGEGITTLSVPVTVGGLFGIEVYILRFVSAFAEYDLSVKMDYSKTTIDVPGFRSTEESTEWTVQMAAGNQGKIGVVFYFQEGRDLRLPPIASSRR